MIQGNIDSFETMGLVDGPGVRFVVFLQGCPIRCAYCHNPEMWDANLSKIKMTPAELVAKVLRFKTYYKNDGGITVSGGEPLMQAEFVMEVFKLCKQNNIHTCLDTSGQGDDYEELLDFCDLVILDVKEIDKDKYLKLVGKDITKFTKFLNVCQKKNKKMWLRQVIVPNFNDSEESILKLKMFAKKLKNIEKIELLPYHTMAKEKYKKLGIKYRLENTPEMDKQRCQQLEKLLKD